MTAFRILRWGDEGLSPVVCIHDVREHARRFERLARILEPGRHVVAYDLRGHGRSPWSGPHTMEQHLADLDDVMATCTIDQAGLIGEGLGARIAIAYASDRQERVNSLTLLDPPLAAPSSQMLALAENEREDAPVATVDEAIEQLRRWQQLRHTPRALLEEEMAEHLVADDDGMFRYRYNHAAATAAFELLATPEESLDEVLCPTLIVHGHESWWLTDGDVEAAADAIRRCRTETVPGSHAVLWDAFAETSAHVRSFLVAKKIA
jgi:pimeloyl-ACP methyl ester carboxylesterase